MERNRGLGLYVLGSYFLGDIAAELIEAGVLFMSSRMVPRSTTRAEGDTRRHELEVGVKWTAKGVGFRGRWIKEDEER